MQQYDQTIYDTAIRAGFTPTAAKLIVAQARFESSDYTSNVFKANNNTSGMKFIGQPLATRGTLAPMSERSASCRSGGECRNSDHYAKFKSVADSASDKIERLYSKTMGGVTPDQLKNAKSPEEFANLLKRRNYYGANETMYGLGLRAKLLKIQVTELVQDNKGKIALFLGGAALLGAAYYLLKKR